MDTPSPPAERVEPCFRCGKPAEEPAVGSGHVAGQEQGRVAICTDCFELLLGDSRGFWDGMPKGA